MPYRQLKLPIVAQLFVVQIDLESKCLATACRVTKKCMQGLGGDALVDGDMGISSNVHLPSIYKARVQMGSTQLIGPQYIDGFYSRGFIGRMFVSVIVSKVNHKNCF